MNRPQQAPHQHASFQPPRMSDVNYQRPPLQNSGLPIAQMGPPGMGRQMSGGPISNAYQSKSRNGGTATQNSLVNQASQMMTHQMGDMNISQHSGQGNTFSHAPLTRPPLHSNVATCNVPSGGAPPSETPFLRTSSVTSGLPRPMGSSLGPMASSSGPPGARQMSVPPRPTGSQSIDRPPSLFAVESQRMHAPPSGATMMNPQQPVGGQPRTAYINPMSTQPMTMQQTPQSVMGTVRPSPVRPSMQHYQNTASQLSGPSGMILVPPGMNAGPPGINAGAPRMGGPTGMNIGPPQISGTVNRQPPPMGGAMSGPMAGPMGGGPQKRIDPNQMPNPIQVMLDDQESFINELFLTSTRGKVPPLVSTNCRIQDDGNCSPRYMRSTVYSVPCNQDMLKDSNIPMAVVCTPFAKIPQNELQLRYVDHGLNGPVRCNRCKAYMNPFMQFIDGGRRFVCNICSHSNEVPQEYFCHLDHQGKRVDMYERPELCFGSFEYIATTDYCKDSKFPGPPAFIFMIDVSYQSIQQGMVKILANELHTLLDNLPKDVGMVESLIKVGFVTYDTKLHFYNVKDNLAQPQMMVVSDLDDAFVPLLDGFLVDYKDSKAVVDTLLDMLPSLFQDTRETDVILGPVIAAGLEALKGAGISGKLYIFHSSLPIAEAPGKLKNREDRKLLGTDKEKNILAPNGDYYLKMARQCVDNGVSIDLFLFPNSYVDVATIGLMVTQTGGQIYRYSYFKEATHGEQFLRDLHKNLKREVGFDSIMRLRCSTGLRPVEFYGSMMMNNTTDVELASIDSDKAISIEIKHDDKIPEDGVAFVQCAVLYTSVSGQRRLRIHNLAFSTCSQLAELYRCCELDTTVNFLSKYALRQVLSSTPTQIKDTLIQRCVQILACYRQHCATPSTSGQLILPECMKLLPLYVNCLIKSDVLAGGSEMSSDDRAFLMQACLSMTPSVSSSYFYPRVIALHTVDTDHDDEDIPDQLRCLGEKFDENGVYLLENTISMFIWVGLQVDPRFLQDVFGVTGIGQLDIEMTRLPEIDTSLSKRIRQIIESIQDQRQRYLKLTVVRQRDKLEPWFKHYIVEDKGFHASQLSYVDFLCHVHREIRNLLS